MKLQTFITKLDSVESERHLRELLDYRREGWGAFWWVEDDESSIMGLFLHGQNGCLFDDRSGEWSYNPAFAGRPGDTVDFMIEDGQLESIPVDVVLPIAPVVDAFVDYYKHGKRSESIQWR